MPDYRGICDAPCPDSSLSDVIEALVLVCSTGFIGSYLTGRAGLFGQGIGKGESKVLRQWFVERAARWRVGRLLVCGGSS